MYFSQNAIILVMLVFVISSVFYATVQYKTKSVEDEMQIKKISMYEHNLEYTIERNINKIVEDAFVNASYKIMKERRFFNNKDEAINYITSYIKNETNKTLSCLNNSYINASYTIDSVNISPTENPSYINLHLTMQISYKKVLNNVLISATKPITIDKEIKLSYIPDPYVYLNKFYYTWHYEKIIYVNNFPNDNNNHTFYIILNNSNFNYTHMYNSSSPREIRLIGYDNVLLPYWVQTWSEGDNKVSIIWVKCNRNQLYNSNGENYILLLYNSTTKVDRQNPENTFILFDDFNYFDYNKWDVSGYYFVNNSKLIVQGLGSSVWSKDTYGPGYELMFKGNFTPVHAQAVGFFEPLSDTDGVGWDCYEWNINWLYMRINSSYGDYVENGINYLNKFYIYDIDRINNEVNFSIRDDNLSIEYNKLFSSLQYAIDNNKHPISINTFTNSNARVSIDWIFLRNISDKNIKTTIGPEYTNPEYKEEKPKTFTGTIYYGDPTQYILVNNGSYSIIGLYTNKTDSWGTVGYKPKIETE